MSELDLDLKEAEYLKRREVLRNIKKLYCLVKAGASLNPDLASFSRYDRGDNDLPTGIDARLFIRFNDEIELNAKLIEKEGAVDL